jgi:hypothetical protein
MNTWERNIALRRAALNIKHNVIAGLLECSPQAWSRIRKSTAPQPATMKRVGLILAIPHHLLISDDAAEVVNFPVPSWDWIDAIRSTGASSKDRTDVASWTDFEAEMTAGV